MKTLDLDAALEPLLAVTIGGKQYQVYDIDPTIATAMSKVGENATDKAMLAEVYKLIGKCIGAPEKDVAKLGMRKINLLMRTLINAVREETLAVEEDAKTVPGVDVKTSS